MDNVAKPDVETLRKMIADLDARVTVACADVTTIDLGGYDAVFLDPARRTAERRIFNIASRKVFPCRGPRWSVPIRRTSAARRR